jgi:hypothetical protein
VLRVGLVYRARRCHECFPPVVDWLILFSLIFLKHIFGIRSRFVMTFADIGKAQNVVQNKSLKNYLLVISFNFSLIPRTIVTILNQKMCP